ncbi:uncharacterized protein MELLADRAFT_69912 [Melampsora larici-populina 98AG31]|uniref:Uncharacterized protein n=1 Tax=Melampsora larici-populina (strain 98AG31 / pathotype 3-4-7) TaxID=747676 RepID=F4SCS2_MELLP|nr:uncharacterized protein MELLADRAFT_69912 [Melampsora larici-populina 98AG31]EGF97554.1 hypothetical protein MELLADRAFT_69912 [Melampsora larici-populina 98AG31]
MSSRRKGNNKDNESGDIVNLLTKNQNSSHSSDQVNQVDSSQNLGNDTINQSDQNQGDHNRHLGTESRLEEQLNEGNSNNVIANKGKDQNDNVVKEENKDKSRGQEKNLVNPNYLAILGDKSPIEKHGITISINSDSKGDFEDGIDLTNKDAVFAKAMALSVKGDGLGAPKYLKVYKTLGKMSVQRPSTKRASSANPILSDKSKSVPDGAVFENGMWFFPGKTASHTKRSYTPYFDKNIDELRYPIPLTIFNKDWQNKAMTCHIKKKTKSSDGEKSDSSYTGLPYADEWLLDYGDWISEFSKFTEWAVAHKANVERVLGEMGWLTALKYNMRVRESAIVNRVEIGGLVAPPDFLAYNKLLAKECFGQSRMREELNFTKNPYVKGGEREGWDPATGKPPKKSTSVQHKDKPFNKWNNKQSDDNPVASGSFVTKEKKKFKSGYNGNNFDPDYQAKKAAAAAAKASGNSTK